MSRNLSGTAITAINSQETDKVFLTLLKLYDPATVPQFSPIYCVNDAYPVTSNSITYQPFPFKLRLPDDQVDGAIRQVQLQIDNIDRSITQVIRSTATSLFPCFGSIYWFVDLYGSCSVATLTT